MKAHKADFIKPQSDAHKDPYCHNKFKGTPWIQNRHKEIYEVRDRIRERQKISLKGQVYRSILNEDIFNKDLLTKFRI